MNALKKIYYSVFLGISIILMLSYGKFVLIPLTFGILLAILFDPFVKKLESKTRNHSLAYLTTVIAFVMLLVLPIYLIGVTIIDVFSKSINNSAQIKNSFETFTSNIRFSFLGKFLERSKIESLIESAITLLQELLGYLIANGMSTLSSLVLSILFSYFLHAYFSSTKKLIIQSSDTESKVRIKQLISRIPAVIRSYVFGTISVMCIIASLSGLLLYIIGLDYAILWGAIIGVLTIIPYLGSAIGITLPLVYSLIQNQSIDQLLMIAGGYLVIQFVEENFITPKIVGDKVGINPFIIVLCMMIMAKLWGIAGIMITIPFIAVFKIVLEEYGQAFLAELVFESKNEL